MKNDVIISFSKPYHHLVKTDHFTNTFNYHKFLNWVSGEFVLFLQDESKHLKIFFPNSILQIKKINQSNEEVHIEVCIKTKVLRCGIELMNKITKIYDKLDKSIFF